VSKKAVVSLRVGSVDIDSIRYKVITAVPVLRRYLCRDESALDIELNSSGLDRPRLVIGRHFLRYRSNARHPSRGSGVENAVLASEKKGA
jgi:hypothetical protein